MGFRELDIKREYRSLLTDVIAAFYAPVLSNAVLYRRAVGFFSSSALVSLTGGIRGLLENSGKMEIIASPRLSEEDLDAIRDGFNRREEIIRECLLRELKDPAGRFEEARLNLLSNLIASGVLDMKIAFLEADGEVGMFHEKLGLVYDNMGDSIAFSGSMNETANAFHRNYESIDVYTSWSADSERVRDKQAAFTAMWGDFEPGLRVIEFPELSQEIIDRYKIRDGIDYTDLEIPSASLVSGSDTDVPENIPRVPEGVIIRDYQLEAIEKWKQSNYRGIFDMATGTGKTYTALAAIAALSEEVSGNLAVIIVCPYQHLVEQWKGDIIAFGMRPTVCYSSSKQTNWRQRVRNSVSGFRIGAVERLCIVTTNATFSTDFMKDQISKLRGNCLIVVDEAHNFGAEKLCSSLPTRFPFRLALSATIDRHGDEEGTARLYSYFGSKCIEYPLEKAIANGMLTPYHYHPIVVSLSERERDEYLELTRKISRLIASGEKASIKNLPESAKALLMKRARIVAGAGSKLRALADAIEPFKGDSHILVYCGATTIQDEGYVEGDPDEGESRQIDVVSEMLGKKLGMQVSQFTSKEDAQKRDVLKREFADAKQMQALVAIRCLDEGVNIPSIKTAFILASSTNPKEYIQRRGRVLRKFEGKEYAEIFDFVTVPVPIDEIGTFSSAEISLLKSLPAREIARIRDFARISENPTESISVIGELAEAFGITPEDEEDSYV